MSIVFLRVEIEGFGDLKNSERDETLDLPTRTFLVIRDRFFDSLGKPRNFTLRDKKSTQDDPFDEYLYDLLSKKLDCKAVKASPLVSPDIVVFTHLLGPDSVKDRACEDLTKVLALEVKKLNRTSSGKTARRSGIDYNTTPPCGKVRVYTQDDKPLDVRAFYLFVCQERAGGSQNYKLTALTLCDGNAINMDFGLYLSAVEPREKTIKLGTYIDGLNRNRPMFVFSNPLGLDALDYSATLIHSAENLDEKSNRLAKVCELSRPTEDGKMVFWCYRSSNDVSPGKKIEKIAGFPTPSGRKKETQSRGRLRLPIKL